MKNSPAFQFYPADFLADGKVMIMDLESRGAYITLLCICWREGSLPSDLDQLAKMLSVSRKKMDRIWGVIGRCFKKKNQNSMSHPRLDREKRRQKENLAAKKRAAETRWNKEREMQVHPVCNAGAMQVQCSSSSSSSSSSPSSSIREEGSASPPPSRSQIVFDCPGDENKALVILVSVPGFKPSDKDPSWIHRLATEFPAVDLVAEARRWRDYKLDKPLDRKSSPRSQFRNWVSIAARTAKENPPAKVPTLPVVDLAAVEKRLIEDLGSGPGPPADVAGFVAGFGKGGV